MPVFYPACTVNVTVRFDDSFRVNEERDVRSVSQNVGEASLIPPPASPQPLVTSTSPYKRERTTFGQRSEGDPPFDPKARTPLTTIANRIPISCSVDMPGPRSASTFSLTLAYRDLPIDPRICKGASVEIYMGAVDPTDFGTGMVRVESDGRRVSTLATHTRSGQRRDDLLLVVGVVDSWRVKHNDKMSIVEMSGRDLRGRLLDAEVDSQIFNDINLKQPIDKVVRDIAHKHPEFTDLQVLADANDWSSPQERGQEGPSPQAGPFNSGVVPRLPSDEALNRNRKGAKGDKNMQKPPGGDKLNFWDLITRYCYDVGAIPFFFTDKLVIKPAATLYKQRGQDKEGAANTPFAGGRQRQLPGGQPFGVRRMVFGRDVLEYSFERKFTGKKRPVVEAVSTDDSGNSRGVDGKILRARFPDHTPAGGKSQSSGAGSGRPGDKTLGNPSKGRATSQTPGGGTHEDPPLRVPVRGVRDLKVLQGVAQAIYEEMGRGELGGSVQTRNLSSFGTDPNNPVSGNQDPDLLRLRPLDAVEILVDLRAQDSGAPLTSSYIDSRGRRDFAAEEAEIASRLGGNEAARQIARVIVAQSRGGILGLQTFFRVGTAHFQWGGNGISISFDFQNYIEVAADNLPMRKGGDSPQIQTTPASQRRSRI